MCTRCINKTVFAYAKWIISTQNIAKKSKRSMLPSIDHAVSNGEEILQLPWQVSLPRSPVQTMLLAMEIGYSNSPGSCPCHAPQHRSCCQQWRRDTPTHLAAVFATLPSTDHAVSNGEGDTPTHLAAVFATLPSTNHAVSNGEEILQLPWQLSLPRSPVQTMLLAMEIGYSN